MTAISRLTALEARADRQRFAPCVGILDSTSGAWRLKFTRWNGKGGDGVQTVVSDHGSEGEALMKYSALMARYKATDAPLIIVDV